MSEALQSVAKARDDFLAMVGEIRPELHRLLSIRDYRYVPYIAKEAEIEPV